MPLTPATRRRLHEVRDELADALQAREDVIVEAFKKGAGLREIAEEVGMSHNGVSKLLERVGVRKRWLSLEDANRELERRDRAERGDDT